MMSVQTKIFEFFIKQKLFGKRLEILKLGKVNVFGRFVPLALNVIFFFFV
jgi:hypothetical protein